MVAIKLKPAGKNRYIIEITGSMKNECILYLRPELKETLEEDCIKQLTDAASLPGIAGPVLAMPDVHTGFGLPIGGVMAMDAENGLVSAGAVGMDINCGVRLLQTNIPYEDLDRDDLKRIMKEIELRVPLGLGKASPFKREMASLIKKVFKKGARPLVETGYGRWTDLEYIEEEGTMPGADTAPVSKKAMSRSDQLGTLGSGNHFIELGYVEEIYDLQATKTMKLEKDTLTVMIHSGSRGFGHQICTDFTEIMYQSAKKNNLEIPTKGLSAAPIKSREGQNYLKAMACAVNFAFANRQLLTHQVREAIADALDEVPHRLGLDPVYDVAHNIAKFEEHGGKNMLIHRKGATRALPPRHPAVPELYRNIGQPAIIPGSMGTASYVVMGTPKIGDTYYSVNHGAGRTLSRTQAKKRIDKGNFQNQMGTVLYNIRDFRKIVDEAPSAYKDIDLVVETLSEIELIQKACRIRPLVAIKGG